ncbi:rRNA methylase [Streptococcus sp. DD10]|uniref:TrmH family RNA methyltransferase n=1 Tax=Streptococcus sp. DD10 TaxID=1777878 RepID=UPI000798E80B|nr:RNA methyltransferase [Streptococcus sp. DD10]KXT74222.1 rRNA methylase [Streptococcus sp. DD10]
MNLITSKSNKVIKEIKKLHQKKYRNTSYLIEGWHLFEEAVEAGAKLVRILVTAEFADSLAAYPQLYVVTPEILQDLTDAQTPQGILAEVALPVEPLPDFSCGRFLFLEDVQDPGNVGTMIRTADAAGYDGVIISKKSADIYNLKTLRSMQGSHFHLPIYRMETEEFLKQSKAAGLPILASTLSENSVDYKTIDLSQNFVLVMGNEGKGISPVMSERADQLVHISMPGQAESLNVAVAAGILMFSLR